MDVTTNIGWPMLDPIQSVPEEVITLSRSFLTEPTKVLSARTKQPEGRLVLQYMPSIDGYHGIWVPSNFPSLQKLIKKILDYWQIDNDNLLDWVKQFFRLRLKIEYFRYFQLEQMYMVHLPPTFVLNSEQIQSQLRPRIKEMISTLDNLTCDRLYQLLEIELPEDLLTIIQQIPAEIEMTYVHLIQQYLQKKDRFDETTYHHLNNLLAQVVPELSEYILYQILHLHVSNDDNIDQKIIEQIVNNIEHSDNMVKIMMLRILIDYYHKSEDIIQQEYYYKMMLRYAPRLSWSRNRDLVNSQLGLARCSVSRGDYFRAMTFYSFARQGYILIDSKNLSKEMELEFQRISVLSANQQLQAGLYQLNHSGPTRNSLMTLIDGIQSTLMYFIRNSRNSIDLEKIIPPILNSAVQSMKLHKNVINTLFPSEVNYEFISDLSVALYQLDDRAKLVQPLQHVIEQLSFKDQRIIERISIFYEDGRHIGDYEMKQGEITKSGMSADQSLFSSAMSAVSMLITEATQSDSAVDEISVGNKTVLYEMGDYITFCLISKSTNSSLKQLLHRTVKSVEEKYGEFLKTWSGNTSIFDDITEYIGPLSFYLIDKGDNENIH